MRPFKFGAIASILTLILFFQPTSSAAPGQGPSASGHGNLTVDADLRTFSFNAGTTEDGEVTGIAHVKSRSTDQSLWLDIDCLEVNGNRAVVSGTITKTKKLDQWLGGTGVFVVHDNGEGNGDSEDTMSLVYLYPPDTFVGCPTLPLPDLQFDPPFFTPVEFLIEAGNIQVKP